MASDTDVNTSNLASLFRRRKQPVTDISVWVQCYSSLVSVLVERYPQYIKHLLAYQSTIAMGAKRTNNPQLGGLRRSLSEEACLYKITLLGQCGPVLVHSVVFQPSKWSSMHQLLQYGPPHRPMAIHLRHPSAGPGHASTNAQCCTPTTPESGSSAPSLSKGAVWVV